MDKNQSVHIQYVPYEQLLTRWAKECSIEKIEYLIEVEKLVVQLIAYSNTIKEITGLHRLVDHAILGQLEQFVSGRHDETG